MVFRNSPAQDYVQSDYSNAGRFKANGSAQEQKFIENLVVESIEIYGQDIYYVPRTIVNKDTVFGEDLESVSKTRQLLYSPVRNLKSMWTIVSRLTSKGDQTKGT